MRRNFRGLGELPDPMAEAIEQLPLSKGPADVRAASGEGGYAYNIVEILPDFVTLHCRQTLSITPAGVAQFDTVVGTWYLRGYDGYAVAVDFEIAPDNDANLGNTYLRVGSVNVPVNSQNAVITGEIDAFWTQISGTKGSKTRVSKLFAPYGRRILRDQAVVATLQYHTLGAGVAFNIEYDVQVRVLNLGNLVLSGY